MEKMEKLVERLRSEGYKLDVYGQSNDTLILVKRLYGEYDVWITYFHGNDEYELHTERWGSEDLKNHTCRKTASGAYNYVKRFI